MKKFAAAVAALVMSAAAHADLVAHDSRFGASTLIEDTNTGLEWLRLDITRGMSFLDVLNETKDGGMFSGFQIASLAGASVQNLFGDNIQSLSTISGGTDTIDFYLAGGTSKPSIVYNTIQFSALFGGQVAAGPDGSIGGFLGGMKSALGSIDRCIEFNLNCGVEYTTLHWKLGTAGNSASATLDVTAQPYDQGNPSLGTWMVMSPVPEPSTYALMLAGLAGVGFVGLRRDQRRAVSRHHKNRRWMA